MLGLDRHWYRVSADTYLSICADTSSPVVRLPVSILYSPHCRVPCTVAATACHPSRPRITHVTAAGGMGEGVRKKQRHSKQSHLKHHLRSSMHGRTYPPFISSD